MQAKTIVYDLIDDAFVELENTVKYNLSKLH
jgi:hypothetical protein